MLGDQKIVQHPDATLPSRKARDDGSHREELFGDARSERAEDIVERDKSDPNKQGPRGAGHNREQSRKRPELRRYSDDQISRAYNLAHHSDLTEKEIAERCGGMSTTMVGRIKRGEMHARITGHAIKEEP